MGPRDIAEDAVYVGRRDKAPNDKMGFKRDQFVAEINEILDEIQENIFQRALAYRKENTIEIEDNKIFYDYFTPQNEDKPEIHGGFAVSGWCGSEKCESKIKEDLAVTIRCIPFEHQNGKGNCICCNKPGETRVIFAKAY